MEPDWGGIIGALQNWREQEGRPSPMNGGEGEPSVSTVAEQYDRDPWAVLASTILSLRTKDEVTLAASRALLEKAPDTEALLALPEEELIRLVYPAGFYRTKAANLRRIARILKEEYGGLVPADMDALLSLPGVGRKTANLVLIAAFGLDGICVDVHVHRICNRTGWVCTRSPGETEEALRERLPRRYWQGINALLVLYGQRLCRPVSPFCSRCVIPTHCLRRGVDRSR